MLTHFFDPCNQGRTINVTPASPNDWEGIEAATGFQEKVEENLNAIRFLIENDIDVVGIEFGNEFYFEEYTSNNNARWAIDLNIQEYLNLSDFYYTALKSDAELNDIPIGAPININQPLTDVWTSAIINHTFPSTALGFDAVIPHYYFYRNENSVIPNNSELQLVYNQNGNVLFDFLNDYLTGENNFDIWLTEWAWVNNASNEGDFRNSFADASYNISMVNNLLRWNFEHENRMPINIHHNLFSPGQSSFGVLFYPNVSSSNILPNNNFYPFFLLNQIHNNFNLCDLTSNNSMIYTNILPSELNIIPYHNPTTNTITFLYANTSDNAVTLDQTSEVTIAGETVDLSELIISGTFPEMNYYDAASLSGDLVGNGTSTNGIMNPKTKNDNWLIPARSIGVITIPIDPCANAPAVVAADDWEDAVEICDLNECYEGMEIKSSDTPDGNAPPCMHPTYSGNRKNVWFKFVAKSKNIDITFSPQAGSGIIHPYLAIWNDVTSNITCVGNPTNGTNNVTSKNLRIDLTNLVVNNTYYISIDIPNNENGLFDLCISETPSNDVWQGAFDFSSTLSENLNEINNNTSVITANNILPIADFGLCSFVNNNFGNDCSVTDNTSPLFANMNCNFTTTFNKLLWFKFTGSNSIHIRLRTGGAYGDITSPYIQLWHGLEDASGNLIGIEPLIPSLSKAVNNYYSASGNLRMDVVNLNSNDFYFISVHKFNGSSGNYFTLQYSTEPSNDLWQGAEELVLNSPQSGIWNTFNNGTSDINYGSFSSRLSSYESPTSTCSNNSNYYSSWFKFVASDFTKNIRLTLPSEQTISNFAIWELVDGVLQQLPNQCVTYYSPGQNYSNRYLKPNLTNGITYYLSVNRYSSPSTFEIAFNDNISAQRIFNPNEEIEINHLSMTANPNPFNNNIVLTISCPDKLNLSLNIFDINGQIVKRILAESPFEKGVFNIDVDTKDLPVGTYFYKLSDGINEIQNTIVLNR